MSFAQEILEYFLEEQDIKSGSSAGEPEYYCYDLQGGFQDTQLVLAMAREGYIVSLVKDKTSHSTYVVKESDPVKTQLDPFVRNFHTASAPHHRKLSNPTSNAENKAESNVRDVPKALSTLSMEDASLNRPVFDDELQLQSPPTREHPNLNIGSRDLDPLGKHPEMKPALTGGIGPDPNLGRGPGLPSEGGMHPTPFGGKNFRYDPPGPGSSFGGGSGFELP